MMSGENPHTPQHRTVPEISTPQRGTVPEISTTQHGTIPEISTFVMFDTESTGLPSPGNNPRITELCFVALTREEFLTRQSQPRVLSKLTLCFNPRKLIGLHSSKITGLYNDSLDLLAPFQKQASLVVSFLCGLPRPICLVAHNGNGFDFPLLMSELHKAGQHVPDDVYCADSLEIFRVMDGLGPVPEFILDRRRKEKPTSMKTNSTGKNKNKDGEKSKPRIETFSSPSKCEKRPGEKSQCDSPSKVKVTETEVAGNLWEEEEKTPEKSPGSEAAISRHKTGSHIQKFGPSESGNVRRQLFNVEPTPDLSSSASLCEMSLTGSSSTRSTPSYKLSSVYERTFGQMPAVSHTAEDDCITLLKVVLYKAEKFMSLCDARAVRLCSVDRMY